MADARVQTLADIEDKYAMETARHIRATRSKERQWADKLQAKIGALAAAIGRWPPARVTLV